MKSIYFPFLILLLLLTQCRTKQESVVQDQLWPPIEPYETGVLKVSDIHEIYYEICGNPKGKPVFMLHGGPGAGCSPIMRRFFNPEKFKIILHDQRGANRSKPFAEIRENTTQDLVQDIEKLRKHLGIEKMMLVGGSWGSMLALAYAETYPENVTEMVLRGIWMGTQKEIDHFYHGGVSDIFPDAYEEFLNALPDPSQRPIPAYLLHLLTGDDQNLRKKIADAWLKYEWKISDIDVKPEEIEDWLKYNDSYDFSLIENYYMANNCFLGDNQLWNNLDKITQIPVIIVNGRFDIPCVLNTAYTLHKRLPESELMIVENGGHGGIEVISLVIKAIRRFE
ncbi:MAG: prolyl aminopeptidase [Bacteroidales bacterium]|nr:prolyl aminopeptidase [Bacteroidales bacterium]